MESTWIIKATFLILTYSAIMGFGSLKLFKLELMDYYNYAPTSTTWNNLCLTVI